MMALRQAQELEEQFLSNIRQAQNAYEDFVQQEGWLALGWGAFSEWWQLRVVPVFRSLDVRPVMPVAKEAAQRLIDETDLSNREIARQTGLGKSTVGNIRTTKIDKWPKQPVRDLGKRSTRVKAETACGLGFDTTADGTRYDYQRFELPGVVSGRLFLSLAAVKRGEFPDLAAINRTQLEELRFILDAVSEQLELSQWEARKK